MVYIAAARVQRNYTIAKVKIAKRRKTMRRERNFFDNLLVVFEVFLWLSLSQRKAYNLSVWLLYNVIGEVNLGLIIGFMPSVLSGLILVFRHFLSHTLRSNAR